MTETEKLIPWTDANQNYLGKEFARLRERLRLMLVAEPTDTAELSQAVVEARAELKTPPAIDRLAEIFELSGFERELLLLCAGVEMDSRLAAQCSEAQGNPQRSQVTFGLAMSALSHPHWSALTVMGPLRRFRMIEVRGEQNLTSASLRIDERILHYIAGINDLDSRLEPLLHFSPSPDWISDGHRLRALDAANVIENRAQCAPILHLCGDDPLGQQDTAALAAHALRRQLLVLRAESLPAFGPELEQLTLLLYRESLLLPAVVLLECGSAGLTPSAGHLLERLPGPAFLSSREALRLDRALLRFDINKPGPPEQKQLWQRALGAAAAGRNGTLDGLAQQFRLSARMIFSTGALMSSSEGAADSVGLWNACRSLARPKLEDLAQRIVPCADWQDLVLPDLQKQMLRQLAAQVRHRMQVYETWGFSGKGRRGLGVSALFTGSSGTGKTMAAEVLALELGLDLYRIDLSAVVSKYIGETEKNLKQLFDAAEEGGVLLLFDEADALFGKRSEVRDSRDRYANIEVGYLLQKMEGYQGLAILTTNLRSSLDRAFERRLRFVVEFPFPDAVQRRAIWQKVFPVATPTRDLDAAKLAQLNVAGGNIRNIALNAAFLAAQAGTAVEMAHLLEAAKLEAQKIERPLSQAEVQGWVA